MACCQVTKVTGSSSSFVAPCWPRIFLWSGSNRSYWALVTSWTPMWNGLLIRTGWAGASSASRFSHSSRVRGGALPSPMTNSPASSRVSFIPTELVTTPAGRASSRQGTRLAAAAPSSVTLRMHAPGRIMKHLGDRASAFRSPEPLLEPVQRRLPLPCGHLMFHPRLDHHLQLVASPGLLVRPGRLLDRQLRPFHRAVGVQLAVEDEQGPAGAQAQHAGAVEPAEDAGDGLVPQRPADLLSNRLLAKILGRGL